MTGTLIQCYECGTRYDVFKDGTLQHPYSKCIQAGMMLRNESSQHEKVASELLGSLGNEGCSLIEGNKAGSEAAKGDAPTREDGVTVEGDLVSGLSSPETLIQACDRLLKVKDDINQMPLEQRKWFFEKEGHADCFVVAKALKDILQQREMRLPFSIEEDNIELEEEWVDTFNPSSGHSTRNTGTQRMIISGLLSDEAELLKKILTQPAREAGVDIEEAAKILSILLPLPLGSPISDRHRDAAKAVAQTWRLNTK